jgi:hypothetical protein
VNKTLIAIATAGLLATANGSLAAPPAHVADHDARPIAVQDRWDDRAGSINEREARIRARIEWGQREGRVTNREARRLHRELAGIEAKERAFAANRRINRREHAELNRDLDRLAQHVRQQIRDDQRRY